MSMYPGETYEGEYGAGYSGGTFGELQEAELAAEILEVTDEQELEEFLDGLMKAAGSFLSGPIGNALGGVLKNVAKTALPVVGGALGSFVAPGVGTAIGSRLGSFASNLFETGYETGYEQEQLETARKVVQLAKTAAQMAQAAPPHIPPQIVADQAVQEAAERLGILPPPQHEGEWSQEAEYGYGVRDHRRGSSGGRDRHGWSAAPPSSYAGYGSYDPAATSDGDGSPQDPYSRPTTGRWIRRGGRIIILGA